MTDSVQHSVFDGEIPRDESDRDFRWMGAHSAHFPEAFHPRESRESTPEP